MKRRDILEKIKQDESKFDVNEIIEVDNDFFKDALYEANKKIRENSKAIKSYLKNPNLALDAEFVNLVRENKKLNAEVTLIEETQKEYL